MESIKKYLWYIVAIGILLTVATTCINSAADKVAGEREVYEKQLERKMDALKIERERSNKLVDSLHQEGKKKDLAILQLRKSKDSLSSKLVEVRKQKDKEITKVKNFTYKESAEFIGTALHEPESASFDDKGVKLEGGLPNKVAETIVENDFLEKEVILTEQKLDNTEKQVSILEDKVKDKDKELESINSLSQKKDEALEASKAVNDSFKKENKKLKLGRVVDKVLIVAAFIGGILIAK